VGDDAAVREGAVRLNAVRTGAALLLALALAGAEARGQTLFGASPGVPEEGRYVGRTVPDVTLTAADGRSLRLAALARDRPLLLALVFSRCVGVCSPLLASLRSAEDTLGEPRDYRTVVLSFDARDTPSDMGAWARRLRLAERADWTFAVGSSDDLPALMNAMGFWSRWDEPRQQFDHPALVVALKHGRVVRMLVGGDVPAVRLQEVVRELRGDFVGAYPLPGKVLVRCFQYDPARGRVVLDWGFLLLLLPAGFTLGVTLALFGLARTRGSGD
jgi:protein SCO1